MSDSAALTGSAAVTDSETLVVSAAASVTDLDAFVAELSAFLGSAAVSGIISADITASPVGSFEAIDSVLTTVSTVAFDLVCSTATAAVTGFADSAGVKGSIGVLAFTGGTDSLSEDGRIVE